MKLLFKMPTRSRPEIFKNVFNMYYNKLSGKHDVQFVITMDYDDASMNNQDMWNWLDEKKNVKYCYGYSRNKVEACNANLEGEEFDVLILLSDDMIPVVDGFDDIIATDMQMHFPDDFNGSVFYNDGRVGNAISTLPIMGKKLYDKIGYVYHPDYISLWCDNEFTDVTRNMNKLVYIDKMIIHHAWENVSKHDELFRHNQNFYKRDEVVYLTRRAKGFPKESIGNVTAYMPHSRRK